MKADKIALITETENGLSYKFAKILRKKDYKVIIAAKGKSYNEFKDLDLEGIELVKIDSTKTSDIVKLYSHLKTGFGKLDILINNAEIANGFGQKITDIDIDDFKHLYNENLFSVINTIKILFPLLNKSKGASIINVTSALGDIDKMNDSNFSYKDYKMTAYSTSKSALNMLTSILDKELKPHKISVKSFDPVRIQNCTHNSVEICSDVEKNLLELIRPVQTAL